MRAALDVATAHQERCEDQLQSPMLTGRERRWLEAEARRMGEEAERIRTWLN